MPPAPATEQVDQALRATAAPAGRCSAVPGAGTGGAVARAPRAVRQGLLALAVYLAVFITVFALPLVSNLSIPDLRQYWTDPNFYTWALRWWPYAVSHGINPLYSSQIGAPHGYDLAWATTTPSVDVLMWPVTAAFGPVVAFNVCCCSSRRCPPGRPSSVARRLTGQFWASLLAGAVYAFTPYELVHDWQGQTNLTVIALLPLLAYLVLRWWDGTLRDRWLVIWVAVVMALEFYTFNEAFVDMTLVGGRPRHRLRGRRPRARRKVARLARLTAPRLRGRRRACGAVPVLRAAALPGRVHQATGGFSLRLVRLILPWSDKVFGLAWLARYSGHVGRPGIDDYVGLPILLVLLGVRRPRLAEPGHPAAGQSGSRS